MLDNLTVKVSLIFVALLGILFSQIILHFYISQSDQNSEKRNLVTVDEDNKMTGRTIQSFGYMFNEKGQLRKFDKPTGKLTNEPFQFKISESHPKNQQNYEDLGEAITEYVYGLLESEAGLRKIFTADDPESFFYASSDALTNTEKLLVLVHGSGVVRAGQWARSLIINDCLESGTQLPYIKRAKDLGYAIIVTNTNHEWKSAKDDKRKLNPHAHMEYVWREYIEKSPAKFKAIVAHSYGGYLVVKLAERNPKFREQIKALAMTDSVHDIGKSSKDVEKYFNTSCRNWVSSDQPLDTAQKTPQYDIPQFSAGTLKHEVTSHSAINSVFNFIESKHQ